MKINWKIELFVLHIALMPILTWAQPYAPVRGIIHLDTSVSGGEYDPEEMVRYLIKNDLEVAIFSDQITTRVQYGVFPAPALTEWLSGKIAAGALDREGSVSSYGPHNYLALLNGLDRKYKNITVIPGVEVFPFYYWQNDLRKGQITMVNGYKHLLAVGMEHPSDYTQMPTVSEGFYKGYNIQTFFSLWPLALLVFAYKSYRQSRRTIRPALYKIPAMIFLIVGVLFLSNNYPYKYGRFDAYHGDQGTAPYQAFVNYVISRGGLVFWAHPEVASDKTNQFGPFKINQHTPAPYSDLLSIHNITGFAAFYEGMKYIIPPGGVWDQVLTQYCLGYRQHPIWAIAEGDVEGDQFDPGLSQTVFLVQEKTRENILQSLRKGHVYALCGSFADDLSLPTFVLSNLEGQQAGMGEMIDGKIVDLQAEIQLNLPEGNHALSAELIKNGVVFKTYKGTNTITIHEQDTLQSADRLHYYRLDVRAPNQTRLLSNPIFARVSDS